MKTIILTFVTILFISINSFSQITKGHWMMGGSASLDFNEQVEAFTDGSSAESTFLQISPDVGFFIIDKLALGGEASIKGYYLHYIETMNSTEYTFGPFIRYYFLKTDKIINVFTDASYRYGIIHHPKTVDSDSQNVKKHVLSFSTGMSVFLNDVVSLDFSIDFSNYKWKAALDNTRKERDIILGLGFQIFLEKK